MLINGYEQIAGESILEYLATDRRNHENHVKNACQE